MTEETAAIIAILDDLTGPDDEPTPEPVAPCGMRFSKQLFRHDPDSGIWGDCGRAALACVIGIDPEDLPHWHEELTGDEWGARMDPVLRERGLVRVSIPFNAPDVESILECGGILAKGMPWFLVGTSANGTGHVVICLDDKIVWDTAIDDSSIVGPLDTGAFWIELLVRPATAMAA